MIECYTAATPNGRRVTMMLELCGYRYERHTLDLAAGQQAGPALAQLNPAKAIPVIVDHDGPGGERLVLSQSGAICLYLAEKAGRFLPTDQPRRSQTLQWFTHALTDVGMMASALHRAEVCGNGDSATAAAFRERLAKHLLVLSQELGGRSFLTGELSIADIALYPILLSKSTAAILDGLAGADSLRAWKSALGALPEVARGM